MLVTGVWLEFRSVWFYQRNSEMVCARVGQTSNPISHDDGIGGRIGACAVSSVDKLTNITTVRGPNSPLLLTLNN